MKDPKISQIRLLLKEAERDLKIESAKTFCSYRANELRGQVEAYSKTLDVLEQKRARVFHQTTTGYFATYLRPSYRTLVHAVDAMTGKPLCGSRVGKGMEFLWTNSAVECERCWEILANKVLR